MPSGHFIRAAAVLWALGLAGFASAQPIAAPEAGTTNLTIFVRGIPIGSEQVSLTRTADGWTVSGTGRIGPPIDAVARRIEIRYTPDWRAREFTLDGTSRGIAQSIHTVVDGNQASSAITTGGQATQKADTIDPNAVVVLPNTFFAPFEAVAARLRTATAGSEIPAYGVPAIAFTIRVGESSAQRIQTSARLISARRNRITLVLPGAALDADLWTDEAGRMIRFSVPAQALDVVREDVASVSSRSVLVSRPNDEMLRIPANGFVLAATVSRPAEATTAKLPAVVVAGGTGPIDRDGLSFGVPLLGQIANAIAEAGFIVVRYDKRGVGQSGGRSESAGLVDYAEDLRAAVKLLANRKDVDSKRISVLGYSEGGTVALLAASKEKKIASVVLLATNGGTGAELVLAQQQHLLERSKMSAEEKQAKIALQQQINQAVISGKGLEQLPPDVRRAADNPEFQSLLTNDPAKVMPNVGQPILIVQGERDTQVAPANADRLETLARQRKKQPAVEVVKVPGVNHLLVPATSGEVDEYSALTDKNVSPAVTQAIVAWLKKTLSTAR
jgi:hypothetical protein